MTRARILGATVENYGPFERADYPLDQLGLMSVEGRNLDDPRTTANGAGKSTLFLDAPTWCLFGEARAGAAADDVVNDIVGRNCAVTVRMELPDVGAVSVQRFRRVGGRNGVRLWIDAHVRDLDAARGETHRAHEVSSLDAAATQKQIEDLLGLDLETWRSAVYRAQDDEERFAALTDSRQKEVLARVFQLDVIDRWREAASVRASELTKQRDALAARRTNLLAEAADRRVGELRAARDVWARERAERLTTLDAELDRLARAWREARARAERNHALQQQLLALRASPPPQPPLDAEPAQPVDPPQPTLPPPPSAPAPRAPLFERPAPPRVLEQAADGIDLAGIEREAQLHEANASALFERARMTRERGDALAARAGTVRARRSGACPECGSLMSPEHADREAARLEVEAGQALQAGQQDAAHARDAAQAASGLRQRAQALRQERETRARVAAEQHRAAVAAWEADVARREQEAGLLAARLAAEDRAQYDRERAAWEATAAHARTRWESERATLWARWREEQAAVARRNADRIARARGDYDARIAAIEAETQALASSPAELDAAAREGVARRQEREALAQRAWPLAGALATAEARAAEVERELADVAARLAETEGQLRIAEWWVDGFGPKGLKSWVLDERVQELTDRANAWLRVLTGGVYWVRFETQQETAKGKIVEKFSTRVFRHRPTGGIAERRWAQWSGGQKARVGLAIDFALADAVAARARRAYDLLVLDEVFRHLDAGGREAVLEALAVLRRERGSVVVVDHDPTFKAAFERRIVVELQNERSRVHPLEVGA